MPITENGVGRQIFTPKAEAMLAKLNEKIDQLLTIVKETPLDSPPITALLTSHEAETRAGRLAWFRTPLSHSGGRWFESAPAHSSKGA